MARKTHVTVTTPMRAEMRRRRPFEARAAIAADLGVSESAVRYHTKDLGRAGPSFDVDRAVSLLRNGATRKEAATRLGVSVVTLWKYLNRAGVKPFARFSDVAPRKLAA